MLRNYFVSPALAEFAFSGHIKLKMSAAFSVQLICPNPKGSCMSDFAVTGITTSNHTSFTRKITLSSASCRPQNMHFSQSQSNENVIFLYSLQSESSIINFTPQPIFAMHSKCLRRSVWANSLLNLLTRCSIISAENCFELTGGPLLLYCRFCPALVCYLLSLVRTDVAFDALFCKNGLGIYLSWWLRGE